MPFYADLHVHSRYSRACSRDCDTEHLAWWAGRKGIAVVGTGDFTHPAWVSELRANLVPAEPGLFRLRPELEREVHGRLPAACRTPVRFMLSSEISTIYKRDGRTRKVHHLLYAPSFDEVEEITRRLAKIGNLASDGRPILGLDSRDLLEITLEGGGYLVPAHAWTPWFAVLGSQSGFDDVASCYGDLSGHIHAIETGLSSDPEMNWRVSSLDKYRLVSNSDAHSPPMLGREATVFASSLSGSGAGASPSPEAAALIPETGYFAIKHAIETGEGFEGTIEFFPEEGKYHLDGHRACDVRTTPEETRAAGGICPVCGKKPTVGVQHRVDALADRPAGHKPDGAAGYRSFVPLPEILAEIAGVGPKSKSVERQVSAMVERFGPELGILGQVPLDDLAAKAPSIVVEAIARLRRGEVRRQAGYDGVYGVIRVFDPGELAGAALFDIPAPKRQSRRRVAAEAAPPEADSLSGSEFPEAGTGSPGTGKPGESDSGPARDGLDPGQRAIVDHDGGPLLVVAGPGAGKTRVLVHSIARRLRDGADPRRCLAITFTRRARDELRERLGALVPDAADRVTVATFHGLGLRILREQHAKTGLDADLRVADEPTRRAVLRSLARPGDGGWSALNTKISSAKRVFATAAASAASSAPSQASSSPAAPGADAARGAGVAAGMDMETAALLAAYDARLRERGLVDTDDLLALPVLLLSGDASLAAAYQQRWGDVYVDEYQDIDEVQYALLRLITTADGNVCAIGDPDQAIYGFRGGDVGYFLRFASDYPAARRVELSRNYRSAPSIVNSALQVIRPGTLVPGRSLVSARRDLPDGPVELRACADERAEAEAVAAAIERMLGGASFHALDSRAVDGRERVTHQLSFADFAVLYRTSAQSAAVAEALDRRGFPFQRRSHARLAEMPGVPEILAGMRAPVLDAAPVPVAEQVSAAVEAALAAAAAGSAGGSAGGPATKDRGAFSMAGHGRSPTMSPEQRIAAIKSAAEVLTPLAARCGTDTDRFLDELSLGAEVDAADPRADRISLLTLHASKGLEFPVVFIIGCDDGLLPLRGWQGAEADYDEERRLLFVGMTRAMLKLVLLTAASRTAGGAGGAGEPGASGGSGGLARESRPSPFLASIDPALLDRSGGAAPASRSGRSRRRDQGQQLTLL
ncbi:MAG: UvrD-helicase domain-containing protein [Nocardiopsaceae bacterium]|nr:UvrD-helicase domain-containing protein [Nocardiopsaceae bacterium]